MDFLWAYGIDLSINNTTDVEKCWERIHFITDKALNCDLVMDLTDSDIL